MHTGQKEQKYGLAIDFKTTTVFESFVAMALGSSPNEVTVLPNEGPNEGVSNAVAMMQQLGQSNAWWVNQNQTLKEEIAGGYLWSPKTNKNGAFNQFYENMKSVAPGDIVFSYADQKIRHIGYVLGRAVRATKPAEFGTRGDVWSDDGWLVCRRFYWRQLENPIRPKEYISELLPTLPAKYSPLQQNGDGLQSVYIRRNSRWDDAGSSLQI